MTFEDLLTQLPTTDQDAWAQAAVKQLKGNPLESIHATVGGVDFVPYQTASAAFAKTSCDALNWTVGADLRGKLFSGLNDALNTGAQALLLDLEDVEDYVAAVKDIKFDFVQSLWLCSPEIVYDYFIEHFSSSGESVEGSIEIEASSARTVVNTFTHLPGTWRPLLSIVDQNQLELIELLSTLLNKFIELGEGLKEDQLCNGLAKLNVLLPIPQSYPDTLVLLRAIRVLHANTCRAFAIDPLKRDLQLTGLIQVASNCNRTEDYLVQASASAVAAITGGIDSLTIEPYSGDRVDARRAVTALQVLSIESNFDHAQDAVAGSAWVEHAVTTIAAKTWKEVTGIGA